MITIKATRKKFAAEPPKKRPDDFSELLNPDEFEEITPEEWLSEQSPSAPMPPEREIPLADEDPTLPDELVSAPGGYEPKPVVPPKAAIPPEDAPKPEPEEEEPELDSPPEYEEVELPGLDLDDWNTLPPTKQIDIVIAMNIQREMRSPPMDPFLMEIDYVTLPQPKTGAVRFYPKRLVKPEEKRVFGTGRQILTAWDYTRGDYRRFVISQITRSEIKEV